MHGNHRHSGEGCCEESYPLTSIKAQFKISSFLRIFGLGFLEELEDFAEISSLLPAFFSHLTGLFYLLYWRFGSNLRQLFYPVLTSKVGILLLVIKFTIVILRLGFRNYWLNKCHQYSGQSGPLTIIIDFFSLFWGLSLLRRFYIDSGSKNFKTEIFYYFLVLVVPLARLAYSWFYKRKVYWVFPESLGQIYSLVLLILEQFFEVLPFIFKNNEFFSNDVSLTAIAIVINVLEEVFETLVIASRIFYEFFMINPVETKLEVKEKVKEKTLFERVSSFITIGLMPFLILTITHTGRGQIIISRVQNEYTLFMDRSYYGIIKEIFGMAHGFLFNHR